MTLPTTTLVLSNEKLNIVDTIEGKISSIGRISERVILAYREPDFMKTEFIFYDCNLGARASDLYAIRGTITVEHTKTFRKWSAWPWTFSSRRYRFTNPPIPERDLSDLPYRLLGMHTHGHVILTHKADSHVVLLFGRITQNPSTVSLFDQALYLNFAPEGIFWYPYAWPTSSYPLSIDPYLYRNRKPPAVYTAVFLC